LVLVLDVRAIRPLVYPYPKFDEGSSVGCKGCDVKLGGISGTLCVSNQHFVHPDVGSTVHAVEAQAQLGRLVPRRGDVKGALIGPRRILSRNEWRADGNGKLDIGVVWNAVSLELPVAGDLDHCPLLRGVRWSLVGASVALGVCRS